MEPKVGIEPTSLVYKARALPLSYEGIPHSIGSRTRALLRNKVLSGGLLGNMPN